MSTIVVIVFNPWWIQDAVGGGDNIKALGPIHDGSTPQRHWKLGQKRHSNTWHADLMRNSISINAYMKLIKGKNQVLRVRGRIKSVYRLINRQQCEYIYDMCIYIYLPNLHVEGMVSALLQLTLLVLPAVLPPPPYHHPQPRGGRSRAYHGLKGRGAKQRCIFYAYDITWLRMQVTTKPNLHPQRRM